MKRMQEDDDVKEFWSVEPELVRCLNQLAGLGKEHQDMKHNLCFF
jgi:hypothetical protein